MDPGGQQLVVQLMLTTGIWLLQPWRPFLKVKDCSEEIESTRVDQIRQKHLCQQADQAGEESFKLRKIREREMTTHRQVRK